jgi:synaptotagmin-14/16
MGVRFRLYGCERMRRERMIGECVVSFTSINLELETTMWVALEPRANLTVSIHL